MLCLPQEDHEDEEEEEEEEEDSFIDNEGEDDAMSQLRSICRSFAKGRNYAEDDSDFDDASMEVSWRDIEAEERRRCVHMLPARP